jgi:hypothetical protein
MRTRFAYHRFFQGSENDEQVKTADLANNSVTAVKITDAAQAGNNELRAKLENELRASLPSLDEKPESKEDKG